MIIFARVAHTRYLFKIVFQGLAGFIPAFLLLSVCPLFWIKNKIFYLFAQNKRKYFWYLK